MLEEADTPALKVWGSAATDTSHTLTQKKHPFSNGIQMAGVKGRSGGARPGAGRKKNPENEGAEYSPSTEGLAPLEALEVFMNDPAIPVALRIKAATAAAPFKHKRLGEAGKKESPKSVGAGADGATTPSRFSTRTGPRGTQH